MVDEILSLGFDTIEISHGLKVSLLPGILKAWQAGRVKVAGLHNYCPSPVEVLIDAPDAYEFTSHRQFERERAMSLTLKTIEFAAQFQAKYVVVHMGSVPITRRSRELTDMVRAGKLNSREFVKKKLKWIEAREKTAPLYFNRAKEALEKMAEHAKKFGVVLGVESRSRYEDMPDEREMVRLMEHFREHPNVGYWHDFGHVQLKHNLSLLDHFEWLTGMQEYLVGCHLHDVVWPHQDHRVPLSAGGVEYERLLPLVAQEKPVVWEISPRRRKETILEFAPKWRALYEHRG